MADSSNNTQSILPYVWGLYRSCAAKARELKRSLFRWRAMVLGMVLSGAVLGTLSQQLTTLEPGWIANWLGILSTALVALSAFLSKELLKPEEEQHWIQARSAAETFKSAAYLYATKTAPYNGPDADKRLSEKVQDLNNKIAQISITTDLSEAKKSEGLLPDPLPVEQYLVARVDNQIKYYNSSARKNETILKRWNSTVFLFGAISVILIALGKVSNSLIGWITLISTITATIVAYVSATRYNYLTISYQCTARQLEKLRTDWQVKNISDAELINGSETVILNENQAWLVEWSRKGAEVNKEENNHPQKNSEG